jgi:hypothetical protein
MKQTLLIDASSIKESDCLAKFNYMNIMGLRTKYPAYKMEYGTAGHNALEHWYKTKDKNAAVKLALDYYSRTCPNIPENDFRTPAHLGFTLLNYFKTYENGDPFKPLINEAGVPAVELAFKIPYKAYEKVDVVLCGKIDAIGYYGNTLVILDHKFTSIASPDKYFEQYRMSVQMMMYILGARLSGLVDYYLPVVIDGIFVNKSGARFQRSDFLDYREDQITEYKEWLNEKIDRIVAGIEGRASFARNFTYCYASFGECPYYRICSVQEGYREGVIASLYNVKKYDPETFGEL